ncbi:hypothetical protein BGZ98_001366 [Dissophora globulifera]|nr:hypothetical protein BGZ98_001366 [Dissophora globulifera]
MEEYLSSSEAFAKALKGVHTSPAEKIRLASEAWRRPDVVLPHKQEFLLEWLCAALVKSSSPSQGPKDRQSRSTLTDPEYWALFKNMLSGIVDGRRRRRDYGVAGKRSKEPNTQSTATNSKSDPKSETPSTTVLEHALVCFELLSSPPMHEWFQPTLEQYTPLVQATLETLIDMVHDLSLVSAEKQSIMMSIANLILDRFKRLIVVQPNQKKVFALITGKMFEAVVRARIAVRMVSSSSAIETEGALDAILRAGLFHQEHLQEYTAGYASADDKLIQSYQKQLFEQVAVMIKSEHSRAVLDVLPLLLCYFVEESRRKHKALASGGFDRGMDSALEAEFSFFKTIYVLAQKQLPHLTEESSEESIQELCNIMDAHNNLLSVILKFNLYQPSNDEKADQFVFMSASFGKIYSCLTTADKLSDSRLQSVSLKGIVVLAQLDDRLLKPHLDSLWLVLLRPLPGADGAALDLAKTLLEIYGKASDLRIFLESLFSSLRVNRFASSELASSPIFSKTLLDLVPSTVRTYLPLPQAPAIVEIFATELMTLDNGMYIGALEPIQEATSMKKKRKLNTGQVRDASDNLDKSSAEFIVALFVQFVKGLRITTNQEKQLNQEFTRVYHLFIGPAFEGMAHGGGEIERSVSFQAGRLIPALKLHYALCQISTKYWLGSVSMELIKSIVGAVKDKSGWTDATTLMLNRVVLQHVHLTLFTAEHMSDRHTQHCEELVRFTMESSRLKQLVDDNSLELEPWSGRLEGATGTAFLAASWQIQVNDWFDITCRFGTTQHLEMIARAIVRRSSASLSATSSNTAAVDSADSISIHLLNQILLRSSNFYEVPNFRPIFVQTILHHLTESISALSRTDLERKLAVTIASFTTGASLKESAFKLAVSDAIRELVEVKLQESAVKKSQAKSRIPLAAEEHGPRLLSLLSMIHLLPLDYFEKYERNVILITMVVLEHYIQRRLLADTTGIKCLLLERRISDAIMIWRSDAGLLSYDPTLVLDLLEYPGWNCSTSYGSEDIEGVGRAIMTATCSMLDSAIRFYMTQTFDSVQSDSAYQHLDAVLRVIQEWADVTFEMSSAAMDHRISESRIRVVILSSVCESLVQCLEHHRQQRSKSTAKAKAGSATTSADQETRWTSLSGKIEHLFQTVQSRTAHRIKNVVAVLKSGGQTGKHEGTGLSSTFVEEAQSCMDHFELYKTIVHYRKVHTEVEDLGGCLDVVPDLFLLATALVQALDRREHSPDPVQGIRVDKLVHLAAILTSYACQYLPLSQSWLSGDEAEKSLRGLLVLVLTIAGQDVQSEDAALLQHSYLSMLGSLSGDHFDRVLHWLMEEPQYSSDRSFEELVLVRYLEATFLNARHAHKRRVRRQIARLLTRLVQVLQTTQSVDVIVTVLDIMANICSEPSYELRSWELGLVLEGITCLMSPSTPLLLSGCCSSVADPPRALTNMDTSRIFTALYHVLINAARFRQEELTALIPVFTTILQGMFHGFKSLHASIAKRQQGIESLIKSPFMLLSAGLVSAEVRGTHPASEGSVSIGDPLPVECAENFARLLSAFGSKGVSSLGSYGGNSGDLDASVPSTASPGSFTITTDASKAFGKHAPYILMEYFAIQCSVAASISQQSLRNALLPGLYALLNLCSEWERDMMMVGLDSTGKTLLKGLYADYLKYHKYTGR